MPTSGLRLKKIETITIAGGGGGIRTHEDLATLPVFKTGSFNHSDTPPDATSQHNSLPPLQAIASTDCFQHQPQA